MASRIPNRPSFVEMKRGGKRIQFMITDAPSDASLALYMEEFKKHKVKHVVRVCSPTYNASTLTSEGFILHDWPFQDGEAPPRSVLDNWLYLVDEVARGAPSVASGAPPATIAVHCVAGLGRAPILVAVALMEYGMEAEDAVEEIRKQRRGAINTRQLAFLHKYKCQKGNGRCTVM